MSNWQDYDYDHDGALESGKELSDYAAADQAETQQWLNEFNETADEVTAALPELEEQFNDLAVKEFFDATQQGAHYLILAGQGLADAAYLVAQAAEVVGWLSTAFRWLGYVVPVSFGVAEILEKVENVSEEKALKASAVAVGILVPAMELASAGWDAMMAGKVTEEAYEKASGVIDQAVDLGQDISDVLFGH